MVRSKGAIKNVERMVILKALEDYTLATKDANQRQALYALQSRIAGAGRIVLEPHEPSYQVEGAAEEVDLEASRSVKGSQ
jgi:hypothetical protein